MKRYLFIMLASLLIWGAGMASSAPACPMCKQANEANSARPRAYMYSILFMMSMPAMIFTGFGLGVYRLTKERDAEPTQADQTDQD